MRLTHLLAGLLVAAATALPAVAATYALDPVHSYALFRIRHMNTSWTWGRINAPAGTVEFDPAAAEKTTFNLTLQVANIDTANAQRDGHLKSPDFFNVKEFPTITFKSTATKKVDDKTLEVTGDLTIHGVTKSITTKVDITGTGEMKGVALVGFETTFEIKRSDFGMKGLPQAVGDDVRLTVAIEADQK